MHYRRFATFALLAGMLVFTSATPTSAQGLFDFFFGNRRAAPPSQAQPYADPFDFGDEGEARRVEPDAPSVSYCVRLCDGRYFPIQRVKGATPAETCNSFCPAAKTAIYHGGGIDHAYTPDGKKYSDLPNAFAYRDKIVGGCSCNGKSAYGLARVDVANDPTLRPGDIVATNEGMVSYKGERKGVAQFTPVDRMKVSAEMRSRLSQLKVRPEFNGEERAAPAAETTGASSKDERRGRAQSAR